MIGPMGRLSDLVIDFVQKAKKLIITIPGTQCMQTILIASTRAARRRKHVRSAMSKGGAENPDDPGASLNRQFDFCAVLCYSVIRIN